MFQITLHKNLNAYHRINGVPNHTNIHVKPRVTIEYVSSRPRHMSTWRPDPNPQACGLNIPLIFGGLESGIKTTLDILTGCVLGALSIECFRCDFIVSALYYIHSIHYGDNSPNALASFC